MTSTLATTIYPAEVTTPEGVIRKAKLILADGTATAWVAEGRGVVAAATLEGVTGKTIVGKYTDLLAEDGTTWRVGPGGGCGCNSPLKGWNPSGATVRNGT